jgi:hypothetical protein
MPTDQVRGLKAHGSSPATGIFATGIFATGIFATGIFATGIFGCECIVADNRFPSTGQPWKTARCNAARQTRGALGIFGGAQSRSQNPGT